MIHDIEGHCWPSGVKKALVLSFDDGPRQDIRLARLLRDCGLRGTFNLNSGLLDAGDQKVRADEVKAVYRRHEVAVHTVTHPHITAWMDRATLEAEVSADKRALEALVGYGITGMAYPFGDHSERLRALMPTWGLCYGRLATATGTFRLPDDLLRWSPSAHHSEAEPLARTFVDLEADRLQLFQIWGHSYELDRETETNSWAYITRLMGLISGRDDIWYAAAGEVAAHLIALRTAAASPA